MTVNGSLEVVGLKEALRELNQLNPALRREVTKEYRQITKPVVQAAKARVPQEAPISGWKRNWVTKSGQRMTPWVGSIGDDYIKQKVSGKKPREWAGRVTNLAVFSIAWTGAVNTVYDLAGRRGNGATRNGANMIAGLNARGRASRVLWPAYEMNQRAVEEETGKLVEKVMAAANRKLVKG